MRRFLDNVRGRRRQATATPAEVAALETVLRGDDKRFNLLIEQLRTAQDVQRSNPAPEQMRLDPGPTYENLLFPLEVTAISSEWVPIRDTISGRALAFRATVVRSGFLKTLEGRTEDGAPWPGTWDVAPPDASDRPSTAALALPSLAEVEAAVADAQERLPRWLGVQLPKGTTVYPAATDAAVTLREQDLGVRFPECYRALLKIADGFDTPLMRVLGHRDAYRVDDPDFDGVVISWETDNTDDFVAVLGTDGKDETVRRLDVNEKPRRLRDLAPDVRSYLRNQLTNHP